jgi:catalase (peroxidase I)
VWDFIKTDLVSLYAGCGPLARAAVRFGFHDAGAWEQGSANGGADGSLLLSETEFLRTENAGLATIRGSLTTIYLKYKSFGISAADLVQFSHNVAVVTCPLGPRQLTFVGRPDFTSENPTGLLPDANSPSETLIELFQNKTIFDVDLVALIGAHTTANQFFFDTANAGQPLDSTPGVWDVKFYSEVLAGAPPP